MNDLIRVAAAVPDVKPGNVGYNRECVEKHIEIAKQNGVNLLVFPELCLTGYTCGDLFFTDRIYGETNEAIRALKDSSANISFVVGAPLKKSGRIYDCAVFLSGGRILGVVPKCTIEDRGLLNEKRFFAEGDDCADHIDVAGEKAPFSPFLVFDDKKGACVGIETGNRYDSPVAISSILALHGANIILNPTHTAALVRSRERTLESVAAYSRQICSLCVHVSSGMNESTSDYVCSGQSVIAVNGLIKKQNGIFIDNDRQICTDVDLGTVKAERLRNSSFFDASKYFRGIEVRHIESVIDFIDEGGDASKLEVRKYPFVASDPKEEAQRALDIADILSSALAKRLRITNSRPVVGVSGGLDSTLALLVAVMAVRKLNRPAADALGITMPCFATAEKSLGISVSLMNELGVEARTIDISDTVSSHLKDIGHDGTTYDKTYENAQARERTQVLMDTANAVKGIVVGTGDLSEAALGWSTYNGDHMSMYAVNGSVPKTLIRSVLKHLSRTEEFKRAEHTIDAILRRPVTPELIPGEAQRTEDILGPYELHDFFLYHAVKYGYSPRKIYDLARIAFAADYDAKTTAECLSVFARRFFAHQFKRNCSPDCPATGGVNLSQRGGWRMNSDADGGAYVKEAEEIRRENA